MLASIVIRTLNEARHLDDLLISVKQQETAGLKWEVVLVDSGSTDGTLEIAARHGCRILHITREEFSFGRSLNMGCAASRGDILVFISGHCVPARPDWLQTLCQPLIEGKVAYSYGRQIGDDDSYFSERRIFAKYFPAVSAIPQSGFYCNNANSALRRADWEDTPFDEGLTGLEDMDVAKRLVQKGRPIGYVAEAFVYHHHQESWRSVRRRFEREAIALQQIMPEVHISPLDVLRYFFSSVSMDWRSARRHGQLGGRWLEILQYRAMQFWGAYMGNHEHRKLSHRQKEIYYYPSTETDESNDWLFSHRRPSPNEGK
ncbi:MAG TPA: glycosyltransferase [Aromatoleum sp.]|uniref:glycosyltransferase family 2 protein n=1 Tax=Aromatoleum sp. TaxID=2307007 RepID=UPI002B473947|nr:glycosyltransferase [Aromatoleum sp.]HJV25557.1 glycosyltransferase [Aromatoleum sp.]